jgi:adenine-specific DNA-methyltransferase
VGVQEQFTQKKPPKTYRYDSSLDPALSWDENRDRELAEWLLGLIEQAAENGEKVVFASPQEWKGGGVRIESIRGAADLLKRLTKPFLNWAGKAERHQIAVPTVPLFVHERHSTKAILDGIRNRKAKGTTLDLFGDAQMDIGERLDAYEHQGPWQNRMILGDSLQIMNSMLEFEGLGGQVQMIYIDPPYGVKYGSNFQPFVRRPRVDPGNKDKEMTREPEMVKAYRDTWELGLHSYLSYFRDRLMVAKDLLHASGSVFVQISNINLHHAKELLDEVFGAENFCCIVTFAKTSGASSPDAFVNVLATTTDYLLWYAKDKSRLKYHQLYMDKELGGEGVSGYTRVEEPSGRRRPLTPEERENPTLLPEGSKIFATSDLTSQGTSQALTVDFTFQGQRFHPGASNHWKTTLRGLARLATLGRIAKGGSNLSYIRYLRDFPVYPLTNVWTDTLGQNQFGGTKSYVVQTSLKVVARCILMTTDPGDLVFDPTCGSGTTAYVAEHWGRRWITCDTSRVPLAIARQRLLTATFPYYELKEPKLGPAGGFAYKRKQNKRGEEVGGLVPHITLKSLANDDPPATEVLVDRPEELGGITRVAGPFVAEATIAPAQTLQYESPDSAPVSSGDPSTHIERMTQVLRQSKTLRLPENQSLVLEGIRRLTDGEYLHAEAVQPDTKARIAIVFGPEDGAISSDVVYNAASEAFFLKYSQLYFFGFAIQAKARELLEDRKKLRIPCAYVAVTPDVAMSDLLKTSRASEIFSITGLPDVSIKATGKKNDGGDPLYQAKLAGLDIFDPSTLKEESIEGASLPAWMLDTDYDWLSFHATQVFFPKTSAWDNLQKSLKATFDESVWAHLAGTTSEPFALGDRKRIAVKVIDERGNELMRVLELKKDGTWS